MPLSGSISSGDAISIGNGQLDSVYVNNTYWSLPVDPVFYFACDYHYQRISLHLFTLMETI